MHISHKQFIRQVVDQGTAEAMIPLLDVLILFAKRFGRQMREDAIQTFLSAQYPDALRLYHLLGGNLHYTTLHKLRHQLYRHLGTHHITMRLSHAIRIADESVSGDMMVGSGGSNPSLTVTSGDKIYKRSLDGDLTRLFA